MNCVFLRGVTVTICNDSDTINIHLLLVHKISTSESQNCFQIQSQDSCPNAPKPIERGGVQEAHLMKQINIQFIDNSYKTNQVCTLKAFFHAQILSITQDGTQDSHLFHFVCTARLAHH